MLRRYLAAEPQNGGAHILLGRVLAIQDKTEEARQELEAGLKLQPNDQQALQEIASMELKAKKYASAEGRFRQLVQASPNDAKLRRDLGTSLLGQATYVEAQNELMTAVKLKPNDGEVFGELAIAASNNKDYPLALAALDARAKLLPETPGTYFLRATVIDHLGDKKQATALYKQFLAVANGKYPDQEWQARHRIIAIDPEKKR
jgi:Flp pilus assembly protein TadD